MAYATTLRSHTYRFADLRDLFAKANEEKSGDRLAGLAPASEQERIAAKIALAQVSLAEIVAKPLIDPEKDEVSRLILSDYDQSAFHHLRAKTVGEFREYLLDEHRGFVRFGCGNKCPVPAPWHCDRSCQRTRWSRTSGKSQQRAYYDRHAFGYHD